MKSRLVQWAGVILIIEIGLIHLLHAQAEYEEAAYMGYLFAANFFGALVAAWGINRRQAWGWGLGVIIALGSVAGYAWSRTLGMPGMEVEEWLVPYGIVALGLEAIFILLVAFRPWRMKPDASTPPALQRALPAAGLIVIAAIGFLAYQWDAASAPSYGMHVATLEEVLDAPVTPVDELKQDYGVEVSLVADSMMNTIVDVRLKIVDSDKAHAFLQNQAALLVGQDALILAPHMHSHNTTRLKEGKIFSIFFSTQQIIRKGSAVSLVFGPVRVEPVTVQ